MTNSEDHFSSEGMLYWDGQHWVPVYSVDGTRKWNGQEWTPVLPEDPIHSIELDDRELFMISDPPSGKFSSKPIFKNMGLAIGGDWIAGEGLLSFRPVPFDYILALELLGPLLANSF